MVSSYMWRVGLVRSLIQCSNEKRQLVEASSGKTGPVRGWAESHYFPCSRLLLRCVITAPCRNHRRVGQGRLATISLPKFALRMQNRAEQCWTNCCCSGPAERFAWAEKHGVKPPSYARRPTSSETAQRSQTSGNVSSIAAKEKSTCGEREKSCCKERSIDAASKSTTNAPGNRNGGNEAATKSCGSCCQTSKADDSASQALSSPTKRKIVLSMFAMKCQGKSSAFTLLPWTILATGPRIVMLEHEFGPAHQAVSTDPAPVYSKPDTPPPR